MRHHVSRTNRDEITAAHHRPRSKSIRVARRNLFNQRQAHIKVSSEQVCPRITRITLINGLENPRQFVCFAGTSWNLTPSLLRSALADQLVNVEDHKISVTKNDR